MKQPPKSKTKAKIWVVENGKIRPRSDYSGLQPREVH